jgi:hypothetical protein
MMYKAKVAVCSEIRTKHTIRVCGQNVELCNVKLVVHIVTTRLQKFNAYSRCYNVPIRRVYVQHYKRL